MSATHSAAAVITALTFCLVSAPAIAKVEQRTWKAYGIGQCKKMSISAAFNIRAMAEFDSDSARAKLTKFTVSVDSSAFSVGRPRAEAEISTGEAIRSLYLVTSNRFATRVVLRWTRANITASPLGRMPDRPSTITLRVRPSVSLPQVDCRFGWFEFSMPFRPTPSPSNVDLGNRDGQRLKDIK